MEHPGKPFLEPSERDSLKERYIGLSEIKESAIE